jgi:hypothetical protein
MFQSKILAPFCNSKKQKERKQIVVDMPRVLSDLRTNVQETIPKSKQVSLEEYLTTILGKMLEQKNGHPAELFPQIANQVKSGGENLVDSAKRPSHPYPQKMKLNNPVSDIQSTLLIIYYGYIVQWISIEE